VASVQVWRSQLAANDFPPVCAMTGAPAEMWRKFTFTTTPGWAFMFGAIGAAAFASQATGFLPLTRVSSKRLTTVRLVFLGLIPLSVVFFVAAVIAAPSDPNDQTRSTITGVLVLLGIAALFFALVGVLLARSYFGPTAKITERREFAEPLVEIRRVHPAFVSAVRQHQQARAAQLEAARAQQAPPPPPDSPFPPGKFSC
jgi:hypothetical protein